MCGKYNKNLIIFALSILFYGCANTTVEELPSLDIPLSPILDTANHRQTFVTHDGKELGFVVFKSTTGNAKTALVYLHGLESHAGWFKIASKILQQNDLDIFLLDRRGSGINRENRGFISGHVDSYKTLFSDIQSFIQPLSEHYNSIVLIGLSWGGKLALAYSATYPEDIDKLILITPGIRYLVDVSFSQKLQIVFGSIFNPTMQIAGPIEDHMFTDTPKYHELIRNDPLKLDYASARFFLQSARLDWYVDKNIENNSIPTLLFLAENDPIIDNEGVKNVMAKSASPLTTYLYEDQKHSIQFDAPERMTKDIINWINN